MITKLLPDKKSVLQKIFIGLITLLFVVFLFFFNQVPKVNLVNTKGRTFEKARVVTVVSDNLAEDGKRYGNQQLKLQMLTGKLKGKIVDATSDSGYLFGAVCQKGMKVVTITSISGDISISSVYSIDREAVICVFIILFLLILWLIGGRKGFKSALSLIFTLVCIIFLYLPMIYKGFSPFFAAVVVVILTTVVSMYLISGYTIKTLSAILGTVCGVIIAGIFAASFGHFAGISGFNVSDIESLLFVAQMTHIQIGGLLFSGILIASLGAVMDIGISISSTIHEVYLNTPTLTKKQLFNAGMNVGRDITGAMANTLILAFTGGSLSVLILNYAYNLPYLQIINSYSIGIEIMQGISGSLGVILTAPLVSLIASHLIPMYKQKEQTF
jgi:uncharacterized membrane protein